CRRRRSPNTSSNLLVLFPQLVRDSHHSSSKSFVRLVRLLLKPGTTDNGCLTRQVDGPLFRDGINDDAKYGYYPVGILLATPPLADQFTQLTHSLLLCVSLGR
ncbi:MAG TPA: hypothetical protein VNZ23_09685, partial [Xanthobacteraceae bacterium]|nr:hypothetical protein [Xanthobacteraceae bacterium]